MYELIDTHAHLEEIGDLERVLAEAKKAGIVAVVAVGSDYGSNKKVLQLARTYPGFVYPALGLHPGQLGDAQIDRDLDFIRDNIDSAVAIGEVGLDYHKRVRAVVDKAWQQQVFGEILLIAKTVDKPVIVHSRYAWRDALTLVIAARIETAVFHWYTGTSSVLRDIISSGYYISATPAVLYHEEHRRAVKAVPLERLLLETDAPVVYQRGSELEYQASPADVIKSLTGVAELKGIVPAQIAGATTDNARKLFRLTGF